MTAAPIMVTMAHVRAAGLCAPGVRYWIQRYGPGRPGLARRFCSEGLPVEEVEAFGDHFATKVAAIARKEASSE